MAVFMGAAFSPLGAVLCLLTSLILYLVYRCAQQHSYVPYEDIELCVAMCKCACCAVYNYAAGSSTLLITCTNSMASEGQGLNLSGEAIQRSRKWYVASMSVHVALN